MEQDKTQLRTLFDEEALVYDEARPGYPKALFNDIVSFSHLPANGRILEIGCGTGQATVPMARRGYNILAIELGANMADVARRNLAEYPQAHIYIGAFEQWPLEAHAFDLALSATAFHWIDPNVSYQKVAQALKPQGVLALFWHVHVQSAASKNFFEEVQKVYRRVAPALEKSYNPLLWPGEVNEQPVKDEIEQTGLFSAVMVTRYTWDITYDASSYTRLLTTYSDHRALDSETRESLFRDITILINTDYNGQITKGYAAIVYMAHQQS